MLDRTEWAGDIVGVFASHHAAIKAIERTTSWEFTIEPWEIEHDPETTTGACSSASGG